MWHAPEQNMLIYDTPIAERITQHVPGSVRLFNGYVACPINLYNLQMLRYLQQPVIPPMEGTYDWPGRLQPFATQRITANFLAVHPRAFVLSDMGTGKTLAALWAADYVLPARHVPSDNRTRCLVVAPLSTLQRVWGDAIFHNFLGRRSYVVLHGPAEKRKHLLDTDADFYLINFDGLAVLHDELAKRTDIRMVIIDEASAYRDRATKRHKQARKLLAPRDYLWMMTGTPTPNGPCDAYGLAKLINNCYGESFNSYQNRVMVKVAQWKYVPKTGAHAEAHKLLQPSVRFAISDCVDLPPCTTQRRDVELSPDQAKAYREMRRQAVLMTKAGKPITAANEAVVRMKLIQIACGAIYGHEREIHLLDAGPRIKALREVLTECNEKVIVFAPLTSVLHLLYKELKDYEREIINGEVAAKARDEIFARFQETAAPRVLLADPATMAHGLTLTAASTVVWYAPTDKTELYLQANKRIDRPGQTKTTAIVQLAATSIEREIFRRLESNETMQGLVLKLAKEGI